jgi:hypothetical protein
MAVPSGLYAGAVMTGFAICRLFLGDHPDGMNDPGDVAAEGQKDIEPEMAADPDLQEDAQGREENGENDSDEVHGRVPWLTVRGEGHFWNVTFLRKGR